MNYKKTASALFFLAFLFLFSPTLVADATAQSTGCVITRVGNPKGPSPTLPPNCEGAVPSTGIVFPPNLTCVSVPAENPGGIPGEYCELPPSPNKAYVYIKQSGKEQDWGSKEMIGVIYTVSQRWKQKYPQGHLTIMDITSDYHLSHFWGVAADITATTNGKDCVAGNGNWRCLRTGSSNIPATVELAKLFIDTGYVDLFLFKSDIKYTYIDPEIANRRISTTITKEIFNYAKNRYPKKFTTATRVIQDRDDHKDHFHLYIDRNQEAYDKYYNSFTNTFSKSKLKDCERLTGDARKVCFP